MFYVLITGYRALPDKHLVTKQLNMLYVTHLTEMMVIHGDCPHPEKGGGFSADAVAKEWAIEHEVPYLSFPARWKIEGKSAGPNRNRRMVIWLHNVLVSDDPDYHLSISWYRCFAFLHPKSRGTVNCIKEIRSCSLEVEVIDV